MATTTTQQKWQHLRDGVAKALPAGSDVKVDGAKVTQPQALVKIDGVLALFASKAATKAQAKAAVKAVVAARSQDQAWFLNFVTGLKSELGAGSAVLSEFGLKPKGAPKVPTVEQKALAAAKRRATRKVRGTLSKKQRAAIPAATGVTVQLGGQSGSQRAGTIATTTPATGGQPTPPAAVAGTGPGVSATPAPAPAAAPAK